MTWILVLAIHFGVDNPIIFHIGFDNEASCLEVAENPNELVESIMGDAGWQIEARCHTVYTGEGHRI